MRNGLQLAIIKSGCSGRRGVSAAIVLIIRILPHFLIAIIFLGKQVVIKAYVL